MGVVSGLEAFTCTMCACKNSMLTTDANLFNSANYKGVVCPLKAIGALGKNAFILDVNLASCSCILA